MIRTFRTHEQNLGATVRHLSPTQVEVEHGETTHVLAYERMGRLLIFDGERRRYFTRAVRDKDRIYVWLDGRMYELVELEDVHAAADLDRNRDDIRAPMPGTVIKLNVTAGESVAADQVVAVLEAMKMEHNLRAPRAGVVAKLDVKVGQTVTADSVLVHLEPQ